MDISDAAWPTTLHTAGNGRFDMTVTGETPLTMRRGGRTVARLDTHATALQLTVPLDPDAAGSGWFLGWRNAAIDTSGFYRDSGEDLTLDCAVAERTLALSWVDDHGWAVGASAADHATSLSAWGATLDDFQDLRPGEGGANFDLDATGFALGFERDWGATVAGLRHSRRPTDAILPLRMKRDEYIGAWDGTTHRWDAWCSHETGPDRWFAWGSASSIDNGSDPLAHVPSVRGHIETNFDAATFGLGLRHSSPSTTTWVDLSYQNHDLALDAYLDQGVLTGGITGWYSLDAWADVRTFALRCGRREYHGPWRTSYGFSAMRSDFDIYARYVDSPGIFRQPDSQWEQFAEDGQAWVFSINVGAGYRTPDWELSATGSVVGAILDVDFEDLIPADPPPPNPGPGPGPGPHPTPEPKPSSTLSPGYIFAVSYTHLL